AAAVHFFHHRFKLVTLLDDGAQSLGLPGEVRRRLRLDADGVLGEQLLLSGLELTLAAQLRKAAGNLFRSHGVLLLSLAIFEQRRPVALCSREQANFLARARPCVERESATDGCPPGRLRQWRAARTRRSR